MRTTLNIDDDLLATAQYLARQDAKPVGAVISELARRGLQGSAIDPTVREGAAKSHLARKLAGFGLVPYGAQGSATVTEAKVDALRETEGI